MLAGLQKYILIKHALTIPRKDKETVVGFSEGVVRGDNISQDCFISDVSPEFEVFTNTHTRALKRPQMRKLHTHGSRGGPELRASSSRT